MDEQQQRLSFHHCQIYRRAYRFEYHLRPALTFVAWVCRPIRASVRCPPHLKMIAMFHHCMHRTMTIRHRPHRVCQIHHLDRCHRHVCHHPHKIYHQQVNLCQRRHQWISARPIQAHQFDQQPFTWTHHRRTMKFLAQHRLLLSINRILATLPRYTMHPLLKHNMLTIYSNGFFSIHF